MEINLVSQCGLVTVPLRNIHSHLVALTLCRFRSFISPWATCVLLVLGASTFAQEPAPKLSFQSILASSETCFTGAWKDPATFAGGVTDTNPLGTNDPEARAAAVRYYNELIRNYECRWFDYAVDGYEVRGFFVKPRNLGDERLPVVIYNRGGNADTGVLPMRYIVGKLFPVVEEGFVIVGSMYRGASLDGKPHPERMADEFGGKDVNDVLALLPIIDTMPFANGAIGIWGTSRGGMMGYLAVRRSDRFQALVAESAPTDLQSELEFRPVMENVLAEWIPEYAENRDRVLRERSVVHWVDELAPNTSILILHGTADTRVSPDSALTMAAKLQQLNRPYRLVMFENGVHGLHRTHQEDLIREIVGWFQRKLDRSPTSGIQ